MASRTDAIDSRERAFLREKLGRRSEHRRPGFPRQSPYDVDYMTRLKEDLTVPAHEDFPEAYPFSRQDQGALRAVRELGIGVLWEQFADRSFARSATAEGRRIFREVSALTQSHIFRWYGFARLQLNPRERQRAKRLLKELAIDLGRDERARRRPTDSYSVAHDYYSQLFRIREARKLLRTPQGESQLEKVKEACRLLELPEGWFLRDHGLDEEGRVTRRPLKPKQIARIWTAEMHNITEQTVWNHLASIRHRNSHAN
jgi:hypothetical protein